MSNKSIVVTEIEAIERHNKVTEMLSRYLVAAKGHVADSWMDGFIESGAVTVDKSYPHGFIAPVTIVENESKNVLTCVYCGHEYPQGTPSHGSQILTDHIRVCEKHPLRACEKERDAYKSLLAVCKKALAGQVGSEDLNELDGMEGHIRLTVAIPEMDRVTAINLIDALRQILSAGL